MLHIIIIWRHHHHHHHHHPENTQKRVKKWKIASSPLSNKRVLSCRIKRPNDEEIWQHFPFCLSGLDKTWQRYKDANKLMSFHPPPPPETLFCPTKKGRACSTPKLLFMRKQLRRSYIYEGRRRVEWIPSINLILPAVNFEKHLLKGKEPFAGCCVAWIMQKESGKTK